MKNGRWAVVIVVSAILLFKLTAEGQPVVIASFTGNGQMSWTNAINSNAFYHVEWAAKAEGPWYQTFDNIHSLDGHEKAGFTVSVPMFYRVVMKTNESPQGMVWVEGGDFVMGQPDLGNPTPVHTNFVSGFWIDAMEITKEKWDLIYTWALTNGYSFSTSGLSKAQGHPVHSIRWYDAVKWCNARSQKEGLTPCYYTNSSAVAGAVYRQGELNLSNEWVRWDADGYRLPTEAEWEKGARGGRQGRNFPWGGDTIQHTRANYHSTITLDYDTSATRGYHPAYSNSVTPYTSPAGSFPANEFGMYDVAGNVWEYCWDRYGAYDTSYKIDPHGPSTGDERVLRGGSWLNDADIGPRVGSRGNIWPPDGGFNFLGFRTVRTPQ